jgi:hypothetical protein
MGVGFVERRVFVLGVLVLLSGRVFVLGVLVLLSGRVFVLGELVLFLWFFCWILELFPQCRICYFPFYINKGTGLSGIKLLSMYRHLINVFARWHRPLCNRTTY